VEDGVAQVVAGQGDHLVEGGLGACVVELLGAGDDGAEVGGGERPRGAVQVGEQPLDGDDRPGGVVGHVEVAGEVDAVEVGVVGAGEPPVEPALDGGVGDVEVVQGEDVDPAAGGGVVQAGGGELDRDAQRP